MTNLKAVVKGCRPHGSTVQFSVGWRRHERPLLLSRDLYLVAAIVRPAVYWFVAALKVDSVLARTARGFATVGVSDVGILDIFGLSKVRYLAKNIVMDLMALVRCAIEKGQSTM